MNILGKGMKYIYKSMATCWIGIALAGQSLAQVPKQASAMEFCAPPFDFTLLLSGNFGELRSNHFHGGLDFKTQGVSGKPVRAIADGYIARARVTHGSGYVLDVVYDNGYTTINRHLSAFTPEIARLMEERQYQDESWEAELDFAPGQYPIRAGQVIALSGNTGYSFGPHLHLDVIETATGEYIDALPMFRSKIKDDVAPRVVGFMLIPQIGKGVVEGSPASRKITLQEPEPIEAWGWVGAALRAYDYMNGVSNRYGVKYVSLKVDGHEVFKSDVSRFAYSEHRYINAWTEGAYMKSYIEPGCKLRMLHADANQGWVQINEERIYEFDYTLADTWGNTSKASFKVQGRKAVIPPPHPSDKYLCRYDRLYYLQEPGLELVVAPNELYRDTYLDYQMTTDSTCIASTYRLTPQKVALHTGADLSIALRRMPVADTTKYYMASVAPSGKMRSVGGCWKNGRIHARIRDLGTYTVAIDTLPPRLTPIGQASWGRNGKIRFKARDMETRIISYRGTIDGKYALFGKPNAVNGYLEYRLDATRVKRGTEHRLEMIVTDECGNTVHSVYHFRW